MTMKLQGPEGNGHDLPTCRLCGYPGTDEHEECPNCCSEVTNTQAIACYLEQAAETQGIRYTWKDGVFCPEKPVNIDPMDLAIEITGEA